MTTIGPIVGLSDAEDRFSATEARLECEWGKTPNPQDAMWRGLSIYGEDAGRQEAVEDLQRRADKRVANLATLSDERAVPKRESDLVNT